MPICAILYRLKSWEGLMNHKQRGTPHSLFAHPTLEALRGHVVASGDGPGVQDIFHATPKGDVAALCEALDAARMGLASDHNGKETMA
jgi:hypothetical protein